MKKWYITFRNNDVNIQGIQELFAETRRKAINKFHKIHNEYCEIISVSEPCDISNVEKFSIASGNIL